MAAYIVVAGDHRPGRSVLLTICGQECLQLDCNGECIVEGLWPALVYSPAHVDVAKCINEMVACQGLPELWRGLWVGLSG